MGWDVNGRRFPERLGFAWSGVRLAWRTESSFRKQCWVALALIPVLLVLRPGPVWWALVGLTVAAVLAAELFNTSLEYVVDHLRPATDPRVKAIKDVAAAGVLVVSLGSLWVGALLLLAAL